MSQAALPTSPFSPDQEPQLAYRMVRVGVIIALSHAFIPPASSGLPHQAEIAAASQAASPAGPVEVVRNHIDAYNRRDLDAVVATFSADAKVFIFPGADPVYTGHVEIRGAYGDQLERNCVATMLRECPDLRAEITSWQVLGRYVFTYQLVTLVDAEPPVPYVVIYEVRDGLIRSSWVVVES